MHLLRSTAFLSLFVPTAAVSQAVAPIQSVKSICAPTEAIGFSWKDDKWAPAVFNRSKDIFLAERIDCAVYSRLPESERWRDCRTGVPLETIIRGHHFFGSSELLSGAGVVLFDVMSTYSIRQLGDPFDARKVETCFERYLDKRLEHITCPESRIRFLPDGFFINYPSDVSMDLAPTSKWAKDSLAITIGKCSSLTK